jgi:hypothetical protein
MDRDYKAFGHVKDAPPVFPLAVVQAVPPGWRLVGQIGPEPIKAGDKFYDLMGRWRELGHMSQRYVGYPPSEGCYFITPIAAIDLPTHVQNPQGLHKKYVVSKANGSPSDPDAIYFVLRLDPGCKDDLHVRASRAAARTYAAIVGNGSSHLNQLGLELFSAVRVLQQADPR